VSAAAATFRVVPVCIERIVGAAFAPAHAREASR
jgi:hypothetical protein